MLPLRSLGRKSLIVNLHAQARHKEHITAEPCSHIVVKNSCVTEKLSRMMRSIDGWPARLANLHLKLLMARYIANCMQARVLSCINNHDSLSNTFCRSKACNSWQLFLSVTRFASTSMVFICYLSVKDGCVQELSV